MFYRIIPARQGAFAGAQVIDPDGKELRDVKTVEYMHTAGELPLIRITVNAEQFAELTATRERVEIIEETDKPQFKVEGHSPTVEASEPGGDS